MVGAGVALAGSLLPWYRPLYLSGLIGRPGVLVINGLDTNEGKFTLVLALVALASGLLLLRARGRERRVAAFLTLPVGLVLSVGGGIEATRGKGQFIALATKGLIPAAKAAELAVAKRMFDSGGLSIQVRPGVILVLIGGIIVIVGAVVGISRLGAAPNDGGPSGG